MHRVLREQARCQELSRANRRIKYLEERLDAAEAQVVEQDEQIEVLVMNLSVILHHLTGESVHVESVRNMTMGMLLDYRDPSEVNNQSAVANLVDFVNEHFTPKSNVDHAAVGITRWIAAFNGSIPLLMQYHMLWTMAARELSKPFGEVITQTLFVEDDD